MRSLRILAVGKLTTPYWRAAAEQYAKRLGHGAHLEQVLIKDAEAGLPTARRKENETVRLLQKVRPGDALICLDETGKLLDSPAFAAFLQNLWSSGASPCFLIGGAYGLTEAARQSARLTLSLSPMTFPHELARVLLLEQIYRALNIIAGTGYHH